MALGVIGVVHQGEHGVDGISLQNLYYFACLFVQEKVLYLHVIAQNQNSFVGVEDLGFVHDGRVWLYFVEELNLGNFLILQRILFLQFDYVLCLS